MLRIKQYIFIIFFSVFLMPKGYGEQLDRKFEHGKVGLLNQNLAFNVEVASTEEQRAMGLMNRENLTQNCGMLFIFEQEKLQRVWMKDTLIALDVIFISAQEKVVSIIKDLQPCIKKPCRIFVSSERATYMLEVNAGTVRKYGVEIGQQVLLDW